MPYDVKHPQGPDAAFLNREDDTLRLRVKVRHIFYRDPRGSGFFIMDAEPEQGVEVDPSAMRKSLGATRIMTVKGESVSFVDSGVEGATVEIIGNYAEDARGGFFKAIATNEQPPTTALALRKYLASSKLPGVGPATADALVDEFGTDLLRILDETPQALAGHAGLNAEKAENIGKVWQEKRALFRITSFLGLHGIGETLARKVRDAIEGNDIEARIRANPYILTEVDGIAFAKADKVAMSLGLPEDDPQRIRAALLHVLDDQVTRAGHTALPVDEWMDAAAAFVAQPMDVVTNYCRELVQTRKVGLRRLRVATKPPRSDHYEFSEAICATPVWLGRAEQSIARNLTALVGNDDVRESVATARMLSQLATVGAGLDPSQRTAARVCLSNPVAILTGGPGTGKTTTLCTLVRLFKSEGMEVVLAAPTGRAAKRMEEACGVTASTMHRAIGMQGFGGPHHDAKDPMKGDVFILDETSMVDTILMHRWLEAIPPGARVIFIGDADQLQPVGPGDVLRDIIASKRVPLARLTTVHRNAGSIATAAAEVLAGRTPRGRNDPWLDGFSFLAAADDEAVLERLDALVQGYLARGYSPQDIQVLAAQKDGPLGTRALNERLRSLLNQEPEESRGEPVSGFVVGDRVLQTKNDYKLEVFNGDLGTIAEVSPSGAVVNLEDGRTITYDKASMRNLQPGYVLTVHKAQGGERPVVLVICTTRHIFTLNRNLIYTAITRGKERVAVLGQPRALNQGIRKREQALRRTGLIRELERFAQPAAPAPRQGARRDI